MPALGTSEPVNDGCVSTDRAAQLTTMIVQSIDPDRAVKPATVRSWARSGLLVPTTFGEGKGHNARYDLRDVSGLGTIALARAQGCSSQALRKVQPKLRALGKEWSNAQLLVFRRGQGQTDVLLVETPREGRTVLRSLLEVPGQVVIAQVALHNVSESIRKRFETMLQIPPRKRGRVAGKKYGGGSQRTAAKTSTSAYTSRAAVTSRGGRTAVNQS